jgi:hypothetical protein
MEFEASQQHWFPTHDDGEESSHLDDRECWICRDPHTEDMPLCDGYCLCRGTLGFAHEVCISQWVFVRRKSECPSCGAAYECIEEEEEEKGDGTGASGGRQPQIRPTASISWLGKCSYVLRYFLVPLALRCFVLLVAALVQFLVMPWIYGLAFYAGRTATEPLRETTALNDILSPDASQAVSNTSSELLIFASTAYVSDSQSLFPSLPAGGTDFGVLVEECAARTSFIGFTGEFGLMLCNGFHVFLYGAIVTSFFRMVCRAWREWSKFIVDAPLEEPFGGGEVAAYNRVQNLMMWLEQAQKWLCFAPGDVAARWSFLHSQVLEVAVVLCFTYIARSAQRILVLFLAFLGAAVFLRLWHPPPVVVDRARRFHIATGAKHTASRKQVRIWFWTYILDIVAFSIVLPVLGGFVVHFGGSGYVVTPSGAPHLVITWMSQAAQVALDIAGGNISLDADFMSGSVMYLGSAVRGFASLLFRILSNDTSEQFILDASLALPGLLELTLHWLMGTICVITLVRYESLIILPLFAPGVDFFFIRAIDLTYQDEEESLCWSLVLTQVYDADPLRVVSDLIRLVLVECTALLVFVRFPIIATFALHEYLSPVAAASIKFPLEFGVMIYEGGSGGYGDISQLATFVHFLIFGIAVTCLATFPAQRMQLLVLRPVVYLLGRAMGLEDFLFEKERLAVLDEWLRDGDVDTLQMPYVAPDVMCVRRQRRIPEEELPALLFPRMVVFSCVYLVVSTMLSWITVIGFASLLLFVSHFTATVVCCSLALPFLFWSPRLFGLAAMQFVGVLGFMVVVPFVQIVSACQSVWFGIMGVSALYQQTLEWKCKVRKRVKRRGERATQRSAESF